MASACTTSELWLCVHGGGMFNRTTVWVERTTTDVFACPSKFYLFELPIENSDIILFNDIQSPSGSEKYFLNISPTQSCSRLRRGWVPSPTVTAAVSDLRRTVRRKWLLFRHGPTPRCHALHRSISVGGEQSCLFVGGRYKHRRIQGTQDES